MGDDLSESDLAARVSPASWVSGSSASGAAQDRWFDVLQFDENRKALVVTEAGQWAWTSSGTDGSVRLHRLKFPDAVGVLPILELEPGALGGKLAEVASSLRIPPEDLARALPLADVIAVAFGTRSDYWIVLALRWLDALPWVPLPVAAMLTVTDDRRISQRERQRIRKILSSRGSSE